MAEVPRPNRRAEGRDAEDRAADFLIAKGMTIITRRFKCRHGELDLVATLEAPGDDRHPLGDQEISRSVLCIPPFSSPIGGAVPLPYEL